MRRLTWMRYNHKLSGNGYSPWISNPAKLYPVLTYLRQPMQRTEYYMPWDVVTVDELSKMGFAENYTVCLAYNEETGKWRA